MPKRIQRRRTKGYRLPVGAVYVGRPSIWGNPFHWRKALDADMAEDEAGSRRIAVQSFRHWFADRPGEYMGIKHSEMHARLPELRGRDLACWCPLVDANGNPVPCHADVLLEWANA